MKDLVSVIIPSRNERYLRDTVDCVIRNCKGPIEIIVVLDGVTQFEIPETWNTYTSWVKIINKKRPQGMRTAINDAVKFSMGNFILKLDAHCWISPGFDINLISGYEDKSIFTGGRGELNEETWEPKEPVIDYFYYSFPWTSNKFIMRSCPWVSKTANNLGIVIDDQLTIHGAMWFLSRKWWDTCIGKMQNEGYGGFAGEPLELCMKTWLGGGKVKVNKTVWYGHSRRKVEYSLRSTGMFQGLEWASRYWTENKWEGRIHDFEWLMEKFWPLPTESTVVKGEKYFWPENWRTFLS